MGPLTRNVELGTAQPIFYYVTQQDPRIQENRQSLVSVQDGIRSYHYLHGASAPVRIGGHLGDPRNRAVPCLRLGASCPRCIEHRRHVIRHHSVNQASLPQVKAQ